MTATTKKAPTKAQRLKAIRADYPHVKSIASTNARGLPLRVVISCTLKGEDCTKTRECATQDAFQVKRCTACQREFSRIRRRRAPVEA